METLPELTSFFGWALVINSVLMILSTIALALFGSSARNLHSRIFDIKADDLPQAYFRYLANFKLLIIVFNLTPWLALKLMG